MADDSDEAIHFGDFRVLRRQRVLLKGELPIPLGSRAFDILLLLLERAGNFVSNAEIFARVWPTAVVVDGNLRVHIAGLRKALGDSPPRLIVNVPNRGYSLAVQVEGALTAPPFVEPAAAPLSLPALLNRVIGREQAIQALGEQLMQRRLVTLVGAGGIGKTTVALAVAAERATTGRLHFVDLSSLDDPRLVASALASALGLASVIDNAVPSLLAYLHDKTLLILFDNCEHVVTAVACLAEAILRGAPGVRILATSREPLRAAGEWLQRLQPLALPPVPAATDARTAMGYAAVELFVERVTATIDSFVLLDDDAPLVADICRRLDGIPLAIELAAARVDPFGLRGLAAELDGRFALLGKGRRTALPRHQTLRAALDWSIELLSPRDKAMLLRLSVFAGSFDAESALAVAGSDLGNAHEVLECLSDLSAKSLLAVDMRHGSGSFRLLQTTRFFAAERLAEGGELAAVSRRHAEHCRALLERAGADWTLMPTAQWLRLHGGRIDDIRAALAWALAPGGDVSLGVAIVVASAPLLFQMSFAEELRQHAERALAAIDTPDAVTPELAFEINVVLGHIVFHTRGILPASAEAFDRALQIAQTSGSPRLLTLAFSTLWMSAFTRGEPRVMLAFAEKFARPAGTDGRAETALLHDRMMAPTLHFLGDHRQARACAERSLADPVLARPPFLSGAQIDRRVSMGTVLGRVLWLQGQPEQAEEAIQASLDVAIREGESVALAFALAFCACPLAIWSGRIELARERVAWLLRHTLEHSLVSWHCYGQAYAMLLDGEGLDHDADAAPEPVLPAPGGGAPCPPQLVELMATLHPRFATATAFARGDAGVAGWCLPELLRLKAQRVRMQDPRQAEALLQQSLALARRDGAVAWEQRTSASLAQLMVVTR